MSEFDRFLCQCKPRVMSLLVMRLNQLKPEEVNFVLQHEDWQIEQFLSLLVSAGASGAMRYLHNYGGKGKGEVVAGMAATLDLEQIVSQRFADGNAYTYLQVAFWIAKTHKVCLDYFLKGRVESIVLRMVRRQELFKLSGGTAGNLGVYSSRAPVMGYANASNAN